MVMRQKVWIDHHVQGVLVGRVILYWFGMLLYFGLSIACYQWWQNPEWTVGEHFFAMFDQVWPCLPSLVLILPLVIFDIVRLSNRFAGPIYRLRMHLVKLNENTNTYPLNFRDDDYWQQLAEPINSLHRTILILEQKVEAMSFMHQNLVPSTSGGIVSDSSASGDFVSTTDEAQSLVV
jgi:hypothetical protein